MLLGPDSWPAFVSVMGGEKVEEEATTLLKVPAVLGEALQPSFAPSIWPQPPPRY